MAPIVTSIEYQHEQSGVYSLNARHNSLTPTTNSLKSYGSVSSFEYLQSDPFVSLLTHPPAKPPRTYYPLPVSKFRSNVRHPPNPNRSKSHSDLVKKKEEKHFPFPLTEMKGVANVPSSHFPLIFLKISFSNEIESRGDLFDGTGVLRQQMRPENQPEAVDSSQNVGLPQTNNRLPILRSQRFHCRHSCRSSRQMPPFANRLSQPMRFENRPRGIGSPSEGQLPVSDGPLSFQRRRMSIQGNFNWIIELVTGFLKEMS